MTGDPFRTTPKGLELRVRLTPRADRDAMEGVVELGHLGSVIAARVRAVPEKDAANATLVRLIAGWLDVSCSSVSLQAGTTQRIKTLLISGLNAKEATALQARLVKALQ